MTSIEWFIEQLEEHLLAQDIVLQLKNTEAFEQAKEMHKAEILAAANTLLYHSAGPGDTAAETYYQETFKQPK
jgi:hypothetical protein